MNKSILIFVLALMIGACAQNDNGADAYGNFEADEILIPAEIHGKLVSVNFNTGDRIMQGQQLAEIDSVNALLQIAQVEAQKKAVLAKQKGVDAKISTLEQQKQTLQKKFNRIDALLNDGAATQQQFDDVEGAVLLIEKQMEEAKVQYVSLSAEKVMIDAQRNLIAEQLRKCNVTSLNSGTVLEKYVENGEMVVAGKAICKIANLDQLNLKCYVSGDQLSSVKIGQAVSVFIDVPNNELKKLTGKITWIASEAEFTPKIIQTREERVKLVYAMKVVVENDGSLKIGMPAEVRF